MLNTLKLKDGTVIKLGADKAKRNGNKREVVIDAISAKMVFKEGGARRFTSTDKASRWAKSHNFEVVSSFSA